MKLEHPVQLYRREGDIREWHLVLPGGLQTACGVKTGFGHLEDSKHPEISCGRCRRTKAWKSLVEKSGAQTL